MQTLRKKSSPLKYKNETTRFLGDGVSFKAKLIGILEVSEARGDRMCQEALSDLKIAIRAAGEHKQRITINIAIDGLRLRDEKTGDSLYHHPVHKISFIAQDMTDSRAFGYIFGSPDTGHRFFGIKTDKAASQVVIAMRDLFQVVFALKKKEIELAKQHLDKNRYGTNALFTDSSSTNKVISDEASSKPLSDSKGTSTRSDVKSQVPAVADLVDLELELNSLQQGISQMERITPSDPFGSKDDPFGDSFTAYPPKPILPPPPSGRERSNRTSESSSIFSPKTPIPTNSIEPITSESNVFKKEHSDYHSVRNINSTNGESKSGDWFTPSTNDKTFDEPKSILVPETKHNLTKQEILSQFDVFTELDPLGTSTGKIKPYIDKKDFFHELKNPPKKVLNDLVSQKLPQESKLFNANFEEPSSLKVENSFNADPFGEDPFDTTDPFAETEFSRQDPFDTEHLGMDFKTFNKDIKPCDFAERFKFPPLNSAERLQPMYESCLSKLPVRSAVLDKQISLPASSVQFSSEKPIMISQIHENHSLDMSSESELAPEPPPRPTSSIIQMKPPPLPPKKQPGEICIKPPPRPPYTDDSHYDYMDNFETGPNSIDITKKLDTSPSLPAPARKAKFETAFMSVPERPKKQFNVHESWSSEEDYLTPISFPQKEVPNTPELLTAPQKNINKHTSDESRVALETKSKVEIKKEKLSPNPFEGLDITLSQLTNSGLNELAVKLNIPQSQLSNMTLVQLTEYVSNFIQNKSGDISSNTAEFKADFANFNNFDNEPYDKYAVFRDLVQDEFEAFKMFRQTKYSTEPEDYKRKKQSKINKVEVIFNNKADRYAALREMVDDDIKQTVMNESNSLEELSAENVEIDEDIAITNETNIIDSEEKLLSKDSDEIIEYTTDIKESISPIPLKSPIPIITEVIQNNNPLTSGSLSDVVSGSSPEIDNTGSGALVVSDKNADVIGESWAVFDQPHLSQQSAHDKHSEEGVSPWSSDSKEFGNGSPQEWKRPVKWERHRRDQEGWWDTSAEPEAEDYPQDRHLTNKYEEVYDYYERPSRRRHLISSYTIHGSGGGPVGASAAGGHSSSSRDASPWEEEPRRRNHKETWSRHPRQHSLERQRRHADSWDEEDDYEYDEAHSGRYHWPERHGREIEKDRHREQERWVDDWADSRRHRRRRDADYDHWCCPDWEQEPTEEPPVRYNNPSRWRKHEDRYYSREEQESPWEDDYANEPEPQHPRYLSATMKRNWKRPSSASEMDRKTGEIKGRPGQYYMATGGSDGERDRRYKAGRRSRSRDSQFTDTIPHTRHKSEANTQQRGSYRSKQHSHLKESEIKKVDSKTELIKKSSTLGNRKKTKESPKTEEPAQTFSRKFENNFVPSETESPVSVGLSPRFNFENEFETSEAESPIVTKPVKGLRFENEPKRQTKTKKTTFKEDTHVSPSSRTSQKSPFDDDFSPPNDKCDQISASSIKEEADEGDDSLSANSFKESTMRKKILCLKTRNNFHVDTNITKSESVNIFARENDPFDDEFFCQSKNSDSKWTEGFQNFDFGETK